MLKILLSIAVLVEVGFATEIQTRELPLSAIQKQNKTIVKLSAEELSKTLPQTIDKYTRLIKIDGIDTTLLYTYEINTGSKSDDAVKKEDRTRMKEAVTYGVCRGNKKFLQADIGISYIYLGARSKTELFRFDIKKKNCNYSE